MDLPARIPDDHVHLVAVTNVLDFTGWNRGNVVVTDQFCFARFFGEQQIPAVLHGNSEKQIIGPVRSIRPNEIPNVHDLLSYLMDPPQVRLVRNSLTPNRFLIPYLEEEGPRLAYFHAEYVPDTQQIRAILESHRKGK